MSCIFGKMGNFFPVFQIHQQRLSFRTASCDFHHALYLISSWYLGEQIYTVGDSLHWLFSHCRVSSLCFHLSLVSTWIINSMFLLTLSTTGFFRSFSSLSPSSLFNSNRGFKIELPALLKKDQRMNRTRSNNLIIGDQYHIVD